MVYIFQSWRHRVTLIAVTTHARMTWRVSDREAKMVEKVGKNVPLGVKIPLIAQLNTPSSNFT